MIRVSLFILQCKVI